MHEGYPVIYLESALAPRIALDMQSGDVQVKVETYGEAAKDECGAWNHYLYAVLLKYFMKIPGMQSIQVQTGPYYTVIQGEYDGKTIAAEIDLLPQDCLLPLRGKGDFLKLGMPDHHRIIIAGGNP